MTFARYSALLFSAALVMAPTPVKAAVGLEKLTQPLIQIRAGEYLREQPKTAEEIGKRVGVPITLQSEHILYERTPDGTPILLRWQYQTTAELNDAQKKSLDVELTQTLDNILGQFRPGGAENLLGSEDLLKVRKFYKFEVFKGSPPPPPVAQRPAAPAIAWPGYVPVAPSCGCCGYRWAPVPYPAAAFGLPVYALTSEAAPEANRTWTKAEILRDKAAEGAAGLCGRGSSAYWGGRLAQALEYLDAAVELNGRDAASWYFLALTQRSLGNEAAAVAAARYGAALQLIEGRDPDGVAVALERVQGERREFLRACKAAVADERTARSVLKAGPALARSRGTDADRTIPAIAAR